MWSDIQYLNYGTMKQIEAFHVLTKLNVFNDLQTYKPLLIGTIPIDIDSSCQPTIKYKAVSRL
jgi:hypothetical protein